MQFLIKSHEVFLIRSEIKGAMFQMNYLVFDFRNISEKHNRTLNTERELFIEQLPFFLSNCPVQLLNQQYLVKQIAFLMKN